MVIKTSLHLGVARLVKLDPFGKKIVMIEFAIVVVEGAPDQLTSVSASPPLRSQPNDQFHEQSSPYQFFALGTKPCFILALTTTCHARVPRQQTSNIGSSRHFG